MIPEVEKRLHRRAEKLLNQSQIHAPPTEVANKSPMDVESNESVDHETENEEIGTERIDSDFENDSSEWESC